MTGVSTGIAMLEAGGATLRIATEVPPAVGARVAVAIRPEAITLLPADAALEGAETQIAGTVEQAIFKGQSLDVWAGTPAGRLLARLDRRALAALPQAGSACTLRIAPTRAILLPAETEAE